MIGELASIGAGIFGAITNSIEARKLKEEIENFKRQQLLNPAKDIKLSTLKADNQTNANLSSMATSVDALQSGGTRAVLGGLPRLNESNIALQNMIAQDLADQDIKRDYAIAQGEKEIRAIRENREQNALLGLGQALQTAKQNAQNGLMNIFQGGLALEDTLNNTVK